MSKPDSKVFKKYSTIEGKILAELDKLKALMASKEYQDFINDEESDEDERGAMFSDFYFFVEALQDRIR